MSRAKGDIAEENTCKFLQQQGYIIIERNFYSRFGEIDIIASRDSLLHFIEVKSAVSYELAIQNVTPKKIERILKTVNVYMKKNSIDISYCIDVAVVTPEDIVLLENITF
ncbi:MAG: YraN family protein [Campylobacterota bacterium]|nr:YraN family protein [Campylobacterota bacterium]